MLLLHTEEVPSMPYRVVKRGKKWALVNKNTGKTKSHHPSRAKAQGAARAIYASKRKK